MIAEKESRGAVDPNQLPLNILNRVVAGNSEQSLSSSSRREESIPAANSALWIVGVPMHNTLKSAIERLNDWMIKVSDRIDCVSNRN